MLMTIGIVHVDNMKDWRAVSAMHDCLMKLQKYFLAMMENIVSSVNAFSFD
jgi:hypothetical protein